MPFHYVPQGGWGLVDFAKLSLENRFGEGLYTDGMHDCRPLVLECGTRIALCHMDQIGRIENTIHEVVKWLKNGGGEMSAYTDTKNDYITDRLNFFVEREANCEVQCIDGILQTCGIGIVNKDCTTTALLVSNLVYAVQHNKTLAIDFDPNYLTDELNNNFETKSKFGICSTRCEDRLPA